MENSAVNSSCYKVRTRLLTFGSYTGITLNWKIKYLEVIDLNITM